MDKTKGLSGKSIPLKERVGHVVFAVLLLAYGAYGLNHDDLYIPGKRSRGVHLHGTAAWIMYGAFVCASLNLLAVTVDHCDTSGGERKYQIWARVTQVAGWTLFAFALLGGLFLRDRSGW
jgi:hypothetical protein